jgi:hypothetical protein
MRKIEFETDDEVYSFDIPENWKEVTVEQFCKIMEAQEVAESKNQIMASVKMITAITNIPENILMMTNVDEIKKISECLDFLDTELESTESDQVEVDGETYYIKKDFNDLNMGEVITIETIIEQTNNNMFKAFDQLLCIFLRKKKENGKLETFQTEHLLRADIFKKVAVADIYQTLVFFSSGSPLSGNNMKESSESQ